MSKHRITLHVSERGGLVGHLVANAQDNTTYVSDGQERVRSVIYVQMPRITLHVSDGEGMASRSPVCPCTG